MDKYLLPVGRIAICAGTVIVLAIILPGAVMWFIGGIVLIIIGLRCCRCCRKK